MVGTIGCLGQARLKFGLTCVVLYTVGAVLSSALLGAALGLMGVGLHAVITVLGGQSSMIVGGVVIVCLVGCAFLEATSPRFRIPQRRRQVPRYYWYLYGPRSASFRWGAQLGLGLWTPIVFPLYFGVIALAIASGSPLHGAMVMASYGGGLGVWLLFAMLTLYRTGQGAISSLLDGAAVRWTHRFNAVLAAAAGSYVLLVLLTLSSGRTVDAAVPRDPVRASIIWPGPGQMINVRTGGRSVKEVLSAVSRLCGWRLSAEARVAEEQVHIDFQNAPASEFLDGLAVLFGCRWAEDRSGPGKSAYRLYELRATTELEWELRRLPYIRGRMKVRSEALARLEAIRHESKPEYRGGPEAYAELFLSLLTDTDVDRIVESDYVATRADRVPPEQGKALREFARLSLRNLVHIPEYVGKAEALTPEAFNQLTVIIRALPVDRGGGLLTLTVPPFGFHEAIFRADDLRFPQAVSPYDAAEGRAYAAPEASTQAGEASPRMIDAGVPSSWPEVISLTRTLSRRQVFSDHYLVPFSPARRRGGDSGQYRSWEEFTSKEADAWSRIWWQEGGALFFRTQGWYNHKLRQPPPAVYEQVIRDVRAVRLRLTTLHALASLRRPQLRTLLEQLKSDRELFAVDESQLADVLAIFRSGGPSQRQAMLGRGLALPHFSLQQVAALRAFPDGRVRLEAERNPGGFGVRIEQTRPSLAVRFPKLRMLEFGAYYGSRGVLLTLDVPQEAESRPLLVTLAKQDAAP